MALQSESYNRYYLHPKDQRVCSECRNIFDGVSENFHIKKYTKSGISWNVKCKECANSGNRKRVSEYRKDFEKFIKHRFASYRCRAKEIGVEFDLDAEYLTQLFKSQEGKCFYTDETISFENVAETSDRPHLQTPSLDRLSPDKGYIYGNVVWCSYEVNRMKNEMAYETFIKMCEKILEVSNGE